MTFEEDIVIEFKRGPYSTKVVYNIFSQLISYHDTTYPKDSTKEIDEQFLTEAEAYLMKQVDAWEEGGPWKYGG